MTSAPAAAVGPFAEDLVEDSSDALIALAPNGTILFWNRGAELMYGHDRSAALGRRFDELAVAPEHRENARLQIAGALDRAPTTFEAVRCKGDGARLNVEVSMRASDDVEGRARFVSIRERDTTLLTKMREERDIAARLSGLLEAAPDAMVIVGRDGRVVFVNAQTETLFGYRREELVGQPIEILVPHRYRHNHPANRVGYFSAPTVRPMAGSAVDLFGRRKDGTEFAAAISLSPIETTEGMLVTAAIRDITDRKQLEEELRRKNVELEEKNRRVQEANRLKSEFLANMSHELRTPLNGIIGFAELMHDGKVGPLSPDHKEYLGDILGSALHLLRLINDVLDLAKIESGTTDLRPELVDPRLLVDEVRHSLGALSAAKRIQLESLVAPSVSQVFVDPAKLKQTLYNFLSNALKFTPDGGRVAIRIRPEDESSFRLEVEDTGIGIRTEDFDRLFVEFQQLDASPAKKYQGTGLGLALTRRLVEAQGGRVGVESTPGKGSTFYAVLPRISPSPVQPGVLLDAQPGFREEGEGGERCRAKQS